MRPFMKLMYLIFSNPLEDSEELISCINEHCVLPFNKKLTFFSFANAAIV